MLNTIVFKKGKFLNFRAVNSSDPLVRMKAVVKFYLSGFYKKPKGLKKPYNPILGEVYRCFFHHTKTDSKTFYLAEQVNFSLEFVRNNFYHLDISSSTNNKLLRIKSQRRFLCTRKCFSKIKVLW
jgi:hypothetical protein